MMDIIGNFIQLAARHGLEFTRPHYLHYLWLVFGLWGLGAIAWRKTRPSRLIAALCLRTMVFILIILALSGTSITREEERPAVVLAAVDVSDSMGEQGRAWAIARARKIIEGAGRGTEKGVILFARGSEMKHQIAKEIGGDWFAYTVGTDATDISSAIRAASLAFSAAGPKHLLIFSDGNENMGDARATAAQASRDGVRIDCFSPSAKEEAHASLVKLDMPEEVNVSEKFTLRIIAENSGAEAIPRTLTLMDGEKMIKQWQVSLQPGTNAFELPYDIVSPGTHRLTSSLTPGEAGRGAVDEQSISMPLLVVDRPKVLCLSGTGEGRDFLAEALSPRDIDVKVGGAEILPEKLEELLAYDCVVLSNVQRSSLSERQMNMLKTYVRDRGGGFIMLGGPRSFGPGGYKGTTIEEILPVKIEQETPFETDKMVRLCTILLIDKSDSMSRGFGGKLMAARRAAEELVKQLKPNDRVGVIAFDTGSDVMVPLELVDNNKDYIIDRIRRIQGGTGTLISRSLEDALRQMTAVAGRVKHVILITDGDTNDMKSYDYRSLISSFGREGISVSTVGIGGDVNSAFLRAVSIGSGGDYYYVKDASTLPLIVLEDNRKTLQKSGFSEEAFIPKIGEKSEMLKGISQEQIPRLLGHTITMAKDRAEVALYTDVRGPRDPVLAGWRCGLGKTVAYASDAEARWSKEMVGWEMFSKFWVQVLRWTMRERSSDYYLVRARTEGGRQYCELQTFSPLREGTSFRIGLPAKPGEKGRTVRLHQVAPDTFAGEVRDLAPSIDSVTVEKIEHGKLIDRKEVALIRRIASQLSSPETSVRGNNEDLLRAVAQAARGRLNPGDDELAFSAEKVPGSRSLAGALLPCAFIFLLLEIALRKLRM
ncbi:MAG: VWA domain-containing protein [Candidatus Aureabacteria bacterium]|nr:VWA domain-containing protein [Candidatus Auribacterota bacterium]